MQNKLIFLRQLVIGDCCDTETEQTYSTAYRPRQLFSIQAAPIGFYYQDVKKHHIKLGELVDMRLFLKGQ